LELQLNALVGRKIEVCLITYQSTGYLQPKAQALQQPDPVQNWMAMRSYWGATERSAFIDSHINERDPREEL
jgi:hypothetical protein